MSRLPAKNSRLMRLCIHFFPHPFTMSVYPQGPYYH